ncbi:MAG: outer membrane lipoprotein carrier protein LolA [Geobacter sp.]|nr:outer membrane lipoprotein carrier protein LolA [Geobacter sp.]
MRKIFRYSILLISFTTLFLANAHAASIPAVEGLEILRKGLADAEDFTADIVQEKKLSLMKRPIRSKGMVRFRKPGLFFMEMSPPHASRMLLRNDRLEILMVKEGVRQEIPLPQEENLQRWLSFLSRPVTRIPEGVDIRAERNADLCTLTIIPRKKGQVREFVLAFHVDGRLRELEIKEHNNDRTTIRFLNMRKNVGLTERDFRLE